MVIQIQKSIDFHLPPINFQDCHHNGKIQGNMVDGGMKIQGHERDSKLLNPIQIIKDSAPHQWLRKHGYGFLGNHQFQEGGSGTHRF